jgi:AraC-like DNA-binding protein
VVVVVVVVVRSLSRDYPMPKGQARLARARGDFVWLKHATETVRAHAFARAGLWDSPLPALDRQPANDLERYFLGSLLARVGLTTLAPPERSRALGPPETVPEHSGASLVSQAIGLIHARHAEPLLRQTDIADALPVSSWELSHRLKAEFGKSFPQHLHEARTEHGADLLSHTQLPVTDIATRVGCRRLSDFDGQFQQRYGVTPTEWRRGRRRG